MATKGKKSSPRSSLLFYLQALIRQQNASKIEIGPKSSRRTFIKQTTGAGLSLALGAVMPGTCKKTLLSQRIVIVGGGMAGLNAAWHLKQAGLPSTIYEANKKTGGRVLSKKGLFDFAPDLVTEIGGEYIDTNHEDIFEMAKRYKLEMLDMMAPEHANLQKELFFCNGKVISPEAFVNDFKQAIPKINADYDSLPDEINYKNAAAFKKLDAISLGDYIDSLPLEATSKLLFKSAYITEFGLEAEEQSCINFLNMIGTDVSSGRFEMFGESDERYKIIGGNAQLTDLLANELPTQILTEHSMQAIRRREDKTYELDFTHNGVVKKVEADIVIMTLPFSVLRKLDFAQLKLSEQKTKAIRQLGYGTNSKMIIGVNERIWRQQGHTGYIFTDTSAQSGWDSSQGQGNDQGNGTYTIFTGGKEGANMNKGNIAEKGSDYITQMEKWYPGFSNAHTALQQAYSDKTMHRAHWPSNPYVLGSYASYQPTQMSTFGGVEGEREDLLFFAGEHCSVDFQGYINGAAETGRKAAEEIIQLVK